MSLSGGIAGRECSMVETPPAGSLMFWSPSSINSLCDRGQVTSLRGAVHLHNGGFAQDDLGCPFQLPHLVTHWAQRQFISGQMHFAQQMRKNPVFSRTYLKDPIILFSPLLHPWMCLSLLTFDPFFGSLSASCLFSAFPSPTTFTMHQGISLLADALTFSLTFLFSGSGVLSLHSGWAPSEQGQGTAPQVLPLA